MTEPLVMPLTTTPAPAGRPSGRPGVGFADVEKAADALLREGARPTVDRLRERMGRGSPNTIQPLLDQWWKTLSARLDAGPAALHRIPEAVAHIVEALWLQLLAEARVRARQELSTEGQAQSADRQRLEVRSYVLSLREGELEERIRARDTEIARLRAEGAGLATLLDRMQAERDLLRKTRNEPKSARKRLGVRPKQKSRAPRSAAALKKRIAVRRPLARAPRQRSGPPTRNRGSLRGGRR